MSNQQISERDIRVLRELIDALRDLEQALVSSEISRNLETIAGSLTEIANNAPSPTRELGFLHDALTSFATIGGAVASIGGVTSVLGDLGKTLGGGKIALAIGAIALVLTGLTRLFEDAASSAEDFAETLAGLTHLEKLQHLQELTARLEELDQAWAAALDPDISTIELLEGMVGLEGGARDLYREITALQEATGIFSQEQLDAAIRVAEMEEHVGDLVSRMGDLQAAYDESFQRAYDSISRQIGLFQELCGAVEAVILSQTAKIKNARVTLQRFVSDFFRAAQGGYVLLGVL